MADYSGHSDPYSTTFIPDQSRTWYWGSSKSFSGPETRVPKEYLGYLLDLLAAYQRRVGKAERLSIVLDRGSYVLKGVSLSEDSKKVRERFGWPNPCKHKNKRSRTEGYEVCLDCWEVFCDHPEQSLLRRDGRVVGGWTCDGCGVEVEAYAQA